MKSKILIAVISLAISAQATTVRDYNRKDGSHVWSYERNTPASRASNSPSNPISTPASAIDSAREAQPNGDQTTESNGQPQVIVTATEPPSVITPYAGVRNEWVSDTLNVYGTLSGSHFIRSVIGFDKDQQLVSKSYYTIESDGTFHARLIDPKKQIRFVKVITGNVMEAPKEVPAPVPAATGQTVQTVQAEPGHAVALEDVARHTEPDASGSVLFAMVLIGGVVGLIWWAVVSASKGAAAPAVPLLPPPTARESADQELALADLTNGSPPHRYHLDGFFPKKGESVIWAFHGVKYYRKSTHSEWVGRSAGVSVRVFKGVYVRSGASQGHRVSHSEMDYQGQGTLVITTIGICFIGANSTRIPLSHVLTCHPYSDGIGFDTDYANNNGHLFTQIHYGNVAFIETVLDIMRLDA